MRRQAEPIERLGVDEKSFTKGTPTSPWSMIWIGAGCCL
jgi:hypothetical protein